MTKMFIRMPAEVCRFVETQIDLGPRVKCSSPRSSQNGNLSDDGEGRYIKMVVVIL